MWKNRFATLGISRSAIRYGLLLSVLCIAVTPFAAKADRVYSWVDSEGKKHLSSTPPQWVRNPSPTDPKVEAFENGKPVPPLTPPSQTIPSSPNTSSRSKGQGQALSSRPAAPTPKVAPAVIRAKWPVQQTCTYGNDLTAMGHEELASRYCSVAKLAGWHERRADDASKAIDWARANLGAYNEDIRDLARRRLVSASDEWPAHLGAKAACASESQRYLQQHTYVTGGTMRIGCDNDGNGYSRPGRNEQDRVQEDARRSEEYVRQQLRQGYISGAPPR